MTLYWGYRENKACDQIFLSSNSIGKVENIVQFSKPYKNKKNNQKCGENTEEYSPVLGKHKSRRCYNALAAFEVEVNRIGMTENTENSGYVLSAVYKFV